jgi:signal transduction histidine kinase
VALISTGIVAAVYLVISLVVVLIVTQQLTSDVDNQLTATLSRATSYLSGPLGVGPGGRTQSLTQGTGASQYIWLVASDGTAYPYYADRDSASLTPVTLPAADSGATTPETLSLNGSAVRTVGAALPAQSIHYEVFDAATGSPLVNVDFTLSRVVVGQSMAAVASAQSTVILAESIVGPILLLAVFLGALTVGRRVAAPIELARVRQMEFTADASHELRTPLSVIEAQTSLALAEPRDPAWYRSAFQRVQGESGRIRRLVEDLLWLARFDSTRDRAQAEHVDVAILTQIAADRFTTVAEAKGIRLSVRTAPMPLVVHAPPEWLDRLLGVLLDNACKYVPAGGTIDVAVRAEGNRIRLSVDDSGPGIPLAERERIFDRFRRATDRPGGAGLGLAIANSVVTATGGRWQIWDSPAGGASMGVSWPRSLSGALGSADAALQPAPTSPAAPPAPRPYAASQPSPPLPSAPTESPLPSPGPANGPAGDAPQPPG